MYCNQDGRLTNLSEGKNRRCAYEKCGGWRYVGPNFTKYLSKSGGVTGAWLATSTVCSTGLFSRAVAERVFDEISDSGSYSYANSSIVLSQNFEISRSVRVYYGVKGRRMVVPPGYNLAVFMSSDGSVESEDVYEGQVLTFRSNIVLGSVPGWAESLYDQFSDMVQNALTPCVGEKIRGIHLDLNTGALSVRDCGCYESFLGDLLMVAGGVGGLKQLLKGIGKRKLARSIAKSLNGARDQLREQAQTMINVFDNAILIGSAKSRISGYEAIVKAGLYSIEDYADEIMSLKKIIDDISLDQDVFENDVSSRIVQIINDGGGIMGRDPEVYFEKYLVLAKQKIKAKNEILREWLNRYASQLPPTMEKIRVAMVDMAGDLNRLNDLTASIRQSMSFAFSSAFGLFGAVIAVVELADVYQDKMCVSPFPHNLCGSQADVDPETCECVVCDPDEVLCPASIANLYDDRNNTCIKSCCGGAVFGNNFLGPLGVCYCDCPPGTVFKQCNSGCQPERNCNGTVDIRSMGLCVNQAEIDSKMAAGCEWGFDCSWNCPGKSYTFTANYDCTALSWGVSSTSSDQPHAPGSTFDEWVVEGCSATYKVKESYSLAEPPAQPADPASPKECCKCAYTYTSNYDCKTGTWSAPAAGQPRIEEA